jgi:hypothetical protein
MKNHAHSGARAAGLRLGLFSLMLALSTTYAAKPGIANGADPDTTQLGPSSDQPQPTRLIGRNIPGSGQIP